jgi:CheY-like chemotaxis protein
VALTGFGTEEDVKNAMEAGFRMHLTKPVDLNSLKQVINQM